MAPIVHQQNWILTNHALNVMKLLRQSSFVFSKEHETEISQFLGGDQQCFEKFEFEYNK